MAVETGLLFLGEFAVGVGVGGVLDLLLVVGHSHANVIVPGVRDRDEGHLRAEQPGLDRKPLGLAGVGVHVDLVDRADLVSVAVDGVAAAHAATADCVGTSLLRLLRQ